MLTIFAVSDSIGETAEQVSMQQQVNSMRM